MKKHMKEIRGKTSQELTKILFEKREELRTLRFAAAGARAKNPNALGELRKEIARILTELSVLKRQPTAV